MASDHPFEPKLGKIRAQVPKAPRSFRGKVLHAVSRAGGMPKAKLSKSAQGRFGKGAGVGRVLKGVPAKGARNRRAVVKARVIKLAGRGIQAATAHLRYLQRDGVTRSGEKGELYGADIDRVDAKAFMERCEGDRHQFRFIVAPEDGNQYDDLKATTRKVMAQMEKDLGTRLDWVAVDHFNTGHPHTHIVVRGVDDRGKDLVIAPEYIASGLRERVQAQLTIELGPRSDLEIAAQRRQEVTQERVTSIDRQFLKEAGPEGIVRNDGADSLTQSLRVGRLAQLERFGLATNEGEGQWRLRQDMAAVLQRMGESGDIIKTMHRAMRMHGKESELADSQIHDAQAIITGRSDVITGRLVERGLADELSDRHFLIIEGTDGRMHYADIGYGTEMGALPQGLIVRLTPNTPELRSVDQTIVDVAGRNGGYYSVDAHLKYDPSARQTFAETHARRLEAIRRATDGVDREADGRFRIGPDYMEKALAYEVREASRQPMTVEVLADKGLDKTVRHNGATWLDHELVADKGQGYAQAGFGREARAALQARLQWLVEEGLATLDMAGASSIGKDTLGVLHRRELAAVADGISKEMGKPYLAAQTGELIEGVLKRAVAVGAGKFAVIDRGKDFTLVPWRPVLEKHLDKTVSGVMREAGINWTVGRGRGPERD